MLETKQQKKFKEHWIKTIMFKMIEGFIKNIKMNVFYKPVFVLSFIILILSLFFDTKGLPNNDVQLLSFMGIIYSIFAWIINDFVFVVQQNFNFRPELNEKYGFRMIVFSLGTQFLLFFIFVSLILYFITG